MSNQIREPIFLEPLSFAERVQKKREKLPFLLRVLTSPKTTLALGATLGTMLIPGAGAAIARGAAKAAPAIGKALLPKTVKGAVGMAIGAPIVVGLLKESPKARKFVGEVIDPRKGIERGAEIAKMIEDPKQLEEQLKKEGLWETIKTGAKKGGKYGAIAAGVLGVAALVKMKAPQKVIETAKEYLAARKAKKVLEAAKEALPLDPGLRSMGFTEPQPVGIGGIPIKQPIGMPSGAPGAPISQPAVSNVIQIQIT